VFELCPLPPLPEKFTVAQLSFSRRFGSFIKHPFPPLFSYFPLWVLTSVEVTSYGLYRCDLFGQTSPLPFFSRRLESYLSPTFSRIAPKRYFCSVFHRHTNFVPLLLLNSDTPRFLPQEPHSWNRFLLTKTARFRDTNTPMCPSKVL